VVSIVPAQKETESAVPNRGVHGGQVSTKFFVMQDRSAHAGGSHVDEDCDAVDEGHEGDHPLPARVEVQVAPIAEDQHRVLRGQREEDDDPPPVDPKGTTGVSRW
jgi:hypothetical protein